MHSPGAAFVFFFGEAGTIGTVAFVCFVLREKRNKGYLMFSNIAKRGQEVFTIYLMILYMFEDKVRQFKLNGYF